MESAKMPSTGISGFGFFTLLNPPTYGRNLRMGTARQSAFQRNPLFVTSPWNEAVLGKNFIDFFWGARPIWECGLANWNICRKSEITMTWHTYAKSQVHLMTKLETDGLTYRALGFWCGNSFSLFFPFESVPFWKRIWVKMPPVC